MLIELKFKNFLSYRDETRLLMTNVRSFKELAETNIIRTKRNIQLLKTAALFGSNGGGKTNFILAMSHMKDTIHNSFSDSLKKIEDRDTRDYSFQLSSTSTGEPIMFEVTFLKENIIYRYGFEIHEHEIVSEWLFKKVEVETLLFKRKFLEFKINNSGFPEGNKHKKEVNSNVLFLSHLAQHNTPEAKNIFSWFEDMNVISALDNRHYKNVTSLYLRNDAKFKAWLILAVRFLEIASIELSEENDEIITYHNKFDENNVIIDTVPFRLSLEESQGTRKLIYLLGAIYDTLKYGRILFIDELDSKLHPNLSRKLVEFFHKLNQNGAQIIFTAQDATLLNKELFRRDQIWFVDKNQFGVSELYSMSEFDSNVVRNTSDFRKKYLESVFGAANTIEITEDLIALMNG
ncbi:AAA family ATPase [Ulvibacterium sp.]|uniref:AAA family ATPase n=1 Tax=Ulvibacterium sp. TaxID=2665914 RepID=UPI003CC65243